MKNINVVCYKTGIAKMTTDDLHIDLENNASKLTIDFTDIAEDYPGIGKWVDILMSDGTALRYNLGTDDIVSVDLTYSVTVKGTVIISPFIYDGVDVKFKFVNRNTITIYNQPEAGDSEIAERDDYIFELAGRIDDVEETLELKADLVDGKVPLDQLPNIVEEVEEYDTLADFPEVGEVGIIYLALDTEKAYLWSGTIYVAMNSISATEIKSLYESNPDTNAFTDALLSKLNGITAGADMKKSEFNVNGIVGKVDKAVVADTVLKVPMTYDTLGKFYATVSGYTLLVNTVFILEFPNTTVDLTENVSISLNGISGTYKDLKYADTKNHLLVKHTAELKCRVDYNGTEWYTDGASLTDYEQTIISRIDSSIAVKPISNGITTLLELQGRSLRQEVVNGDFEDGTTNWIGAGASISEVDNTLNILATGQGGAARYIYETINANSYYIEAMIKSTSNLVGLQFKNGTNFITLESHTGSNTYEKLKGIITTTSGNDNDYLYIGDSRISSWDTIYVKEVKLIPISNTPYANYTAAQMSELNLPYYEGELDVVNPSITSVGSNLLDYDNCEIQIGFWNIDGSFVSSANYRAFCEMEFRAGTYAISDKNDLLAYIIRLDDGTEVTTFNSGGSFTITSTQIIKITARDKNGGGNVYPYVDGEENIMLNEGTTALDYTPFKTSTLSITNATFRSVGLAYDRAYQENGIWYKGENVKVDETVVKNATGWTISSILTTTHRFFKDLTSLLDFKVPTANGSISNIMFKVGNTTFTTVSANDSFSNDTENTVAIDTNGLFLLRLNKTTYPDSASFEAYLQANDVTFTYETATETPIEIDVDGSLICDTITTITQTQDLPAQITVKYPVTSKSQIKINTQEIIKTQNEVTKLENTVNPLLTLPNIDVIAVEKTIFKGDSLVINTASGETSLLVPYQGTKIVPANSLIVGQCFKVLVCGYLNSSANSSNTVKITATNGTTYTFINQASTVPSTSGDNVFVKVEFEFKVNSVTNGIANMLVNGNSIIHSGIGLATISGRSYINPSLDIDNTEDVTLDISYTVGSNGTFTVTGSKIILE